MKISNWIFVMGLSGMIFLLGLLDGLLFPNVLVSPLEIVIYVVLVLLFIIQSSFVKN